MGVRGVFAGALAGCVFLGAILGCASVKTPPAASAMSPAPVLDDLATRFSPGAAILRGIDSIEPDATWRPGDRVLFGIAEDGASGPREWYMLVEVREPPKVEVEGETYRPFETFTFRTGLPGGPRTEVTASFALVPMRVEIYDGALNAVSRAEAMMPEISLRHGLIEHIRQEQDGISLRDPAHNGPTIDGRVTASEVQLRGIAGILALIRFPRFVDSVPAVEGLVARLIERPSLLSIIANGGLSMSVRLASKEATAIGPPAGILEPVYRVPVRVEINGRRALDCELLLASAQPPLGPCNGVVGLEAAHPRHPERRVRVRLLAAARGDAPAASTLLAGH